MNGKTMITPDALIAWLHENPRSHSHPEAIRPPLSACSGCAFPLGRSVFFQSDRIFCGRLCRDSWAMRNSDETSSSSRSEGASLS